MSLSNSLQRVRSVEEIAANLDTLVEHGFVTQWQRIAGRYWIDTGGTDGPYSQRQASAWIDGAAAMGAGGGSIQ